LNDCSAKTRLQLRGIGLGLRHPFGHALVARLGLDYRQLMIAEREDVVGDLRLATPSGALDATRANHLAADPAVGGNAPLSRPQRGIDEFGAGLGLVHAASTARA
jgi:hypothetical protein